MNWKSGFFPILFAVAASFWTSELKATEPYEQTPEWKMVIMLEGDSARCAIDNRMLLIKLREADRSASVDEAFRKSRACVDAALPKGREHYRSALQNAPDSKAVLAKTYAAWMTYMETLAVPMETEEQASAKAAFQATISEVKAELDSR